MVKRDDLWDGGPCFYYDTELFPPTTDSFALGYFARPKRGDTVCDLGCGVGLLGTLLLARDGSLRLMNVEIDRNALALAQKTADENGWEASVFQGDLRDKSALPGGGTADYALSNPPYFARGSGKSAQNRAKRRAREETFCSISDICAAARHVLRWGGRFCVVFRPERLTDLLYELRQHGLEPKRLRFVTKSAEAAPSLALVEARRGGKPGLKIEPPLIAGSEEWDRVYFRSERPKTRTSRTFI